MMCSLLKYSNLIPIYLLMLSCTSGQREIDERPYLTDSLKSILDLQEAADLTQEEEAAFEALNTLQTNTDQQSRFYSTFANLTQPCFPPDTGFVVSQSELKSIMKIFVDKFCQNLTLEDRNELVTASVLAQVKYAVLHCRDHSYIQTTEQKFSMTGTWVIPNILGRRDLVLVW